MPQRKERHVKANSDDGSRRSLFRRAKRQDGTDTPPLRQLGTTATVDRSGESLEESLANVDAIARRMNLLASQPASVADAPGTAHLDLQRAAIARANDLAATTNETTTSALPTAAAPSHPMPSTSETPVQQPTAIPSGTTPPAMDPDFEARLDAVLAPMNTSAPAPAPVPAAAPAAAQPSVQVQPQAAQIMPTTPSPTISASPEASDGPSELDLALADEPAFSVDPVTSLGIDVDRVVRIIHEEAAAVQARMERELRDARARAQEIVGIAEDEAERIRDHGQNQARVLLGEVEEIISEAQQTGEQILQRAQEDSAQLRRDATSVLQQSQAEARTIVETARREGEQILAEQRRLATVRAQEAMREQDRLKDQIRRLEERRRQVLESLEPLISQLTQMMPVAEQNVVPLDRQQRAQQLQS